MKELIKMSLAYPINKQTNEELEILSEIWLESFIDISTDVIIDAIRLHREASNYFPTVKDILDCCNGVWEERHRNIKKLPEPIPDLTPEQIKENADKVRKIIGESKPKAIKKDHYKQDIKKRIADYLNK